jgi:transcriptional regulator with XRE-family HTH domain
VSIGDALAAARREAGLTITQVSQRTCIRETIVRGIERGDYSACGGDFYARGHIRSIARAVGLDPDDLVREYDATQAAPQQITAAEVFQPFTPVRLKERRRPNWSLLLIAGLVALLGVAGFKFFGSHSKSPAAPLANSQHDHPSTSASPSTTPVVLVTPHHVRITITALPGSVTWAELMSASGRQVFQGDIGQPGSRRTHTWTFKHPVTVRLGNPAGAELILNGHRQALIANTPETLLCTRTACTETQPVPAPTPTH